MNDLDKIVIFRHLVKERGNIIRSDLFVLISLRHLNRNRMRSNALSIYRHLRLHNRSCPIGNINTSLSRLIPSGFAEKIKTSYYITEAGKQELNSIELELKTCRYKLRKSSVRVVPGVKPLKL